MLTWWWQCLADFGGKQHNSYIWDTSQPRFMKNRSGIFIHLVKPQSHGEGFRWTLQGRKKPPKIRQLKHQLKRKAFKHDLRLAFNKNTNSLLLAACKTFEHVQGKQKKQSPPRQKQKMRQQTLETMLCKNRCNPPHKSPKQTEHIKPAK